jgi:hypothetical protein
LMRLNKSHLVKGASHAMIWRAMLKTPRHLPPHHIKLLDQLYIELQKKKWLAANPYTKSLRLYERLYNGTTRNEKNLNKKEKVILVNAEKRRNPIKTPVGLSTIHADTLALSTINQPFLVELNRIVSFSHTELQTILIWFTQYKDTVEECNVAPHKTTAAILAKFVRLLDDHDRPFFGALFLITFGFAYHEIDTQDAEAQQQTLENCKFAFYIAFYEDF